MFTGRRKKTRNNNEMGLKKCSFVSLARAALCNRVPCFFCFFWVPDKKEEEGEVDKTEGDKVKPPDGLSPDRMRQMTCVNEWQISGELSGPEQKRLSRLSLECASVSIASFFLFPSSPFFLRIRSYFKIKTHLKQHQSSALG